MSHAATLSREPNQTNMTDNDIRGSSLVLAGCLAKRKHMISRTFKERLDMKQFRQFGSVFVKEENWCRSRVCASVQLDSRSVCDFVVAR